MMMMIIIIIRVLAATVVHYKDETSGMPNEKRLLLGIQESTNRRPLFWLGE